MSIYIQNVLFRKKTTNQGKIIDKTHVFQYVTMRAVIKLKLAKKVFALPMDMESICVPCMRKSSINQQN